MDTKKKELLGNFYRDGKIDTQETIESLFQKPYAVVRLRGRLYRNRSRYFAPVSRRSIN